MTDVAAENVEMKDASASEGGEEGEEEMEPLDDSNDEDASYIEKEKIIRRKLAYIYIDQPKDDVPIVYSHHYKYEKYLRDHNLLDVS